MSTMLGPSSKISTKRKHFKQSASSANRCFVTYLMEFVLHYNKLQQLLHSGIQILNSLATSTQLIVTIYQEQGRQVLHIVSSCY